MKINWLILLLVLPMLGNAQISEEHYKIYSVEKGKEVKLKDIIKAIKDADVLFFGEEHNDSVGHYLEHTIFTMMYDKYGEQVALSMEMFDRDVQLVMDEYLKHDIRERNFKKDAKVWSNYKDYRPMVEFAREKGLDVVCANASSRYTNLVGRKGQDALLALSEDAKRFIAPLPYEVASGPYYDKLMSFMSGGAHDPNDTTKQEQAVSHFGGFDLLSAPSLWDATMAWSIANYLSQHEGRKVFQVNGRFHSDQGFAVVTQLNNYRPDLKSVVISSGTEDDFNDPDWTKYEKNGDFIIITDPDVPRTYESSF